MTWVQIVAAVGAAASMLSFAPQAWAIIRKGSTQGLSRPMYALTVLAFACWLTFGIAQRQWALIVPNAICLILAVFILAMILLPARRTAQVSHALDPTAPP
ncbi:SemiSWEET family sugar transporter [Sandarakinorhabdus rubra]|uniref:SemiSWEET family sugar transporter n=1 Tax=Sandarakinorhabdus rubra TaxID=2672568 RepID=UPI0013DCD1DA|nr:SemiSWEET family transporter [Sandarakinorhabdus rubra]